MTLQKEIENNIKNLSYSKTQSEPLFIETSDDQITALKKLIGDKCSEFNKFYQEYQPNHISFLKNNTILLTIDDILEENTELAPGAVLSKLGIIVFATTIGGNVVCIDTNDSNEGDPVVLIIDQSFLYIDTDEDEVEIANFPSYIDENDVPDEDFEFNYENVRKYVYKIEDSFVDFIRKYSKDEYDDLEKYL